MATVLHTGGKKLGKKFITGSPRPIPKVIFNFKSGKPILK
jgi:hypothetical protein